MTDFVTYSDMDVIAPPKQCVITHLIFFGDTHVAIKETVGPKTWEEHRNRHINKCYESKISIDHDTIPKGR